jgi:hypothetical protein
LNKEDSAKDVDAEGDFSEFTAHGSTTARHDGSGIHSLTAEDLQNIIGDNSNV